MGWQAEQKREPSCLSATESHHEACRDRRPGPRDTRHDGKQLSKPDRQRLTPGRRDKNLATVGAAALAARGQNDRGHQKRTPNGAQAAFGGQHQFAYARRQRQYKRARAHGNRREHASPVDIPTSSQ